MDHSPFEGLFKTLLPILIFIIWAMVSRPAQKKKKEQEESHRRRQREPERAGREASRETSDAAGGERIPEPRSAKEDWKRSIEEVLEEMGLPVERPPAPAPIDRPAAEQPAPRSESPVEEQSLETLEPEVVPDKVVPEKVIDEKMKSHLAIQEAAYTLAASPIDSQKVYATAAESTSENTFDNGQEPVTAHYGADELQKFVVWSELLGKPVALREEKPVV